MLTSPLRNKKNWFNGWFYNRALQAFKRKGSILIDVTTLNKKATSYGMKYYNNSNILSNNARFMLGNFNISLYNLNTISNKSDNMNSIVIYTNNGIHDALFMSDMQITGDGLEYGYYAWANVEKDLINEISKDTGAVDVLQLGHHGNYTSNGSDLILKAQPKISVFSWLWANMNSTQVNALNYFGGRLYSLYGCDTAIVIEMNQNDIPVYDGGSQEVLSETNFEGLTTNGWILWSYRRGITPTSYYQWLYAKNGTLVTGWKKVDGKWYYFDKKTNFMQTGWLKNGNKWYYLNESGAMVVGWKKIDGKWYYMKSSGAMQTGWQKVSDKWYYLSASGIMQANKWIGNYYVQSDGSMATNKWIGKYHVNASGKWDKTK